MNENEVEDLLSNTRKYFVQQRDLFGNIIYGEDIKDETGKQRAQIPAEPWARSASLPDLFDQIHECLKCPLGHTRTKFVFGTGNANADVMFICEAPGADEDAQGEPFVGRAGQLLNK